MQRKASPQLGDTLRDAADRMQGNQLTVAQTTLQPYVPDFRSLVAGIRQKAVERDGLVGGPIIIQVEATQLELFPEAAELSKVQRFIDLALRMGALCLPEGCQWRPGLRPRELEVPPLFVWRPGEMFWVKPRKPFIAERGESELLQTTERRFPHGPTSLFVAYRMRIPQSLRFRELLEQAISQHPRLSRLQLLDGHVRTGDHWATEIRNRIRQSFAVVADVTGLRPEVMFEVGYGWGLQKRIVPVVETELDRVPLPAWLTATQLAEYSSDRSLDALVDDLVSHLVDASHHRLSRPPRAVPGAVSWLRVLPWNQALLDRAQYVLSKEGLRPAEVFAMEEDGGHSGGLPHGEASRHLMRSHLLIASLDERLADSFVTFICGALSSTPDVGYGQSHMLRRVIVVQDPSIPGSLVADGLKRCEGTVRVVPADQVVEQVKLFASEYRA